MFIEGTLPFIKFEPKILFKENRALNQPSDACRQYRSESLESRYPFDFFIIWK